MNATPIDPQTAANPDGAELARMYRNRFDDQDRLRVGNFWDLMFRRFLNPLIGPDMTVLDLGAGNCEFINRVESRRRIAVDLNPDVHASAASGVEVLVTRADDLHEVQDGCVDLVFTSNFFEHLRTSEQLLSTLRECRRTAAPQAHIVVLMPNLRAVGPRYYDYLDHCLPVTDRSLVEALSLTGWQATKVIPRLLPYGVNPAGRPADSDGRRARSPLANPMLHRRLLATYFRVPFLWRIAGGQMLVIAKAT